MADVRSLRHRRQKSKKEGKESKAPKQAKQPARDDAEDDNGDDGGDNYVDLGAHKRASISEFKGKTLVDIREVSVSPNCPHFLLR